MLVCEGPPLAHSHTDESTACVMVAKYRQLGMHLVLCITLKVKLRSTFVSNANTLYLDPGTIVK